MLQKLKKLTTTATSAAGKKAAIAIRRTATLPNGLIENHNSLIKNYIDAPAFRGETVLSQSTFYRNIQTDSILSPFKVLSLGINSLYKNSKTVFKNKRKLIPALALAVIWMMLILLRLLGVNAIPVSILSFLTFAQGGLSPNLFHIIGGVIGKGIFAGLVLSFFSKQSLLINLSGRRKQISNLIMSKSLSDLAALLIGVGIALIAYNFMAGHASLEMSMAAVAGCILSLRALGNGTGFLTSFIHSVVAKIKKGKQVETVYVSRIIAGMSIGFVLSVPLSLTNILTVGYLAGFIFLIAGLVLSITSGKDKEVTA